MYRRTDQGRIPAGPDSRAVQLLSRPSPGSTGVDLVSQVMVSLNLTGDAFIGKFRSDGQIVQLGLFDPAQVEVELRGQRVVYTLNALPGRPEVGPADVLHIKGMTGLDGLRGLSPVTQCRVALGLSSSLQASAKSFTERGSRPSGILTVPSNSSDDAAEALKEQWQEAHGGSLNMHSIAVLGGDVSFTPVAFSSEDQQFLQQRELSAREVARVFRCPAWAIDAPTGDSLTYSSVAMQNRALVDHSLRPWVTRIERAISNDTDLCPGGTYVQFDLDALLRGDTDVRSQVYERALGDGSHPGWMTRAEVRELEDLSNEGAAA